MNEVAEISRRLPVTAEPQLSVELRRAMALALEPGHDTRYVSDAARAEAAAALPAIESACARPDAALIERWLRGLLGAVRNPPAGGDYPLRVRAVAQACADVPAVVWTVETQTAAMRHFEFWPSAAELHAFLSSAAALWLQLRAGLRAVVATAVQAEESPRPKTAAEVEELANKLRGLRAGVVSRAPAEPDQAPRAAPVAPSVLNASYADLAESSDPKVAALAAARLRAAKPAWRNA